jgi:hypothetical protein
VFAIAAVAVGVFPSVMTLLDGAWFVPRTTVADVAEAQLPVDPEIGDYRVLYLGDPRLLPVPVEDLGRGVAMAVVDDGALDLRDRWTAPHQDADDQLASAIDEIRTSSTLRGGRLLAPFGVRFVIVPFVDGANSTSSDPLPVPEGLLDAFDSQLDLVRHYSPPSLAVYENRAAIPTTAQLEGDLAEASRLESPDELVRVDTSGAEPTMLGLDESRRGTGTVADGVLHLAVPLNDSWELSVNGQPVAARVGFGVTTVYDVGSAGPAELQYQSPPSRTTWLITLAALWVVALVAASRVRVPARWRRTRPTGETLIDLDTSAQQAAVVERTGVSGLARVDVGAPPSDWVDDWLAEEESQR